jgi:hypothetical protein
VTADAEKAARATVKARDLVSGALGTLLDCLDKYDAGRSGVRLADLVRELYPLPFGGQVPPDRHAWFGELRDALEQLTRRERPTAVQVTRALAPFVGRIVGGRRLRREIDGHDRIMRWSVTDAPAVAALDEATRDAEAVARAAVLQAASGLGLDELAVAQDILGRLAKGRGYYGELRVLEDPRDFAHELDEELEDAIVYASIRRLVEAKRGQRRARSMFEQLIIERDSAYADLADARAKVAALEGELRRVHDGIETFIARARSGPS